MTTSSRRDFLHIAGAGSALAASGVFSTGALAAPADMPQADMPHHRSERAHAYAGVTPAAERG
jgi:hypothetical protein